MVKKILFAIARSRYSSLFIGLTFQHFSKLLPVERLFEDKHIVVFYHPVPFWKFHCLAVPKWRIPSFIKLNLQSPVGRTIITDIFNSFQHIARKEGLQNYRITVNGGLYQDVPQMHFHLSSGLPKIGQGDEYKWEAFNDNQSLNSFQAAILYSHPNPSRQIHYILTSIDNIAPLGKLDFNNPVDCKAIYDIFLLAQMTIAENKLRAYSIITEVSAERVDPKITFHLVSGKRIGN